MVRWDVPKRVTLSNGRTFLALYKQTTRANLPANIHLARPCKQRAAPKGNIGKMALEKLPGTVEKLSGKVKNKRLKKILGSENVKNVANYSAAYGIKKLQ